MEEAVEARIREVEGGLRTQAPAGGKAGVGEYELPKWGSERQSVDGEERAKCWKTHLQLLRWGERMLCYLVQQSGP